ncbi:MAG: DUF2169 domain-containing protein [Sandaracinaceae bacterium]|nr:DUF2169 domain-containing protein [Sandaracinaceae bacterium]
MRLIKPMQVGFLSRPFEHQRRFFLGVAALVGFRFDGSIRLLSEMGIWKLAAAELGDAAILDEGMPKSRAEFFVHGRAYVPGGKPAGTCPVRVRVGDVDKTLYVIGDRSWKSGVPTEPVPFTEMDLGWHRAFGGPDYPRNPQGKGLAPVKGKDGSEAHPLPNVEAPGKLVQSPRDRPEPAGFLPFGLDWIQRREKLGTFDDRWLREEYPGLPRDVDWTAFNVAMPDQQQASPYSGDESFECTNMHPERPIVEGKLPGIRPRCFVSFAGDTPSALVEVPLRATTLWLFPHLETGILVFHGSQPVGEDDAADVCDLLLAAENLSDAPRPDAHYETILAGARAHDPEAALSLITGVGLVPPGCEGVPEIEGDIQALKADGLLQQAQRRRAEEERQLARARLAAAGLDPDVHGPEPLPPEPPPPALTEIPALLRKTKDDREHQEREAEAQRLLMQDQARELCRQHGLDYDSLFLQTPGPPKFDAKERLADIEATLAQARMLGCPIPELEAQVADPAYRAQLEETEANLKEAYRLGAHMTGTFAPRMQGDTAIERHVELLELVRGGHSAAGRDWTGIDLAGQSLAGGDLRGAFLESANLAGADLTDCDLSRAVLAGACLDGAILTGTKLADANLGGASLKGVRSQRPPLCTNVILDGADLTGAALSGISLDDAVIRECTFDGADLARSRGHSALFYRCSMRGVSLRDADLSKASFIELDASGLVASGANLESATLYDVRAEEAKLDRARLSSFRAVGATKLAKSDFSESILHKANFRGIDLSQTRFVRADLAGSDLSEARLTGSDMTEVVAHGALFIRTDFTQVNLRSADLKDALLTKANLTQTDLTGASLFGADLARVRSDGGTKLEGTNRARARVHPTRTP